MPLTESDVIRVRQFIQKMESGLVEGMQVYATYHDSNLAATPTDPTGDGTTGGWHREPTEAANWMSTKTALKDTAGSWGTPIRVFGLQGTETAGVGLSADIPKLEQITFIGDGSSKVGWSAGTVRYNDSSYAIAAKAVGVGETDPYIYWDAADGQTSFKPTDTFATAIAANHWVVCINDSGKAIPATSARILHGGLIQAGTVTATQIIVSGINALDLLNAPSEAGADVTGLHQADILLANLGEVSIHSLAAKNLANLLDNPSFELGDKYWEKSTGWSIVEDAANAYVGDYVAKYLYPGSGSGNVAIYQNITVSEGEIFEVAGYAKNGAGSSNNLYFVLQFYDKDDVEVGAALTSSPVVSGTTYTRTAKVVTTPETAVRLGIHLFIIGVGAGSLAYADMFTIHQVVGSNLLLDGAVVADKIYAGAVTAGKIAAGAVTAGTIAVIDLGGNTRLRIDSNGIYISNDAGENWLAVLYNDGGTVKITADQIKVGTLLADRVAESTFTGVTSEDSLDKWLIQALGITTFNLTSWSAWAHSEDVSGLKDFGPIVNSTDELVGNMIGWKKDSGAHSADFEISLWELDDGGDPMDFTDYSIVAAATQALNWTTGDAQYAQKELAWRWTTDDYLTVGKFYHCARRGKVSNSIHMHLAGGYQAHILRKVGKSLAK